MIDADKHFQFLSEGMELAISFSNDLMALKKNEDVSTVIALASSRLSQMNVFDSFAIYLLFDGISFEIAKCVPDAARGNIEKDIAIHIESGTFSWALDSGKPLSVTGPTENNHQVLFPLSTRRRAHGMFIGNPKGEDEVAGYVLSVIRMILTIATDNIDGMSLTAALRDNNLKLEQRVNERTKELKCAITAAESANRSKSDFLANMSHDIRTPMNGVLGMLDLLRTTSLKTTQKEYIDTAYSSGEHLLSLLNDILDLSKVESGLMEVESIDFNLIKMVDELVALFSVKAKENNNKLYALIDSDVPEVIVSDKTRIWQVLVNLLGNAIKFTSSGNIILRIAQKKSDDGTVDLEFEVEDTGIGIKEESLETVFNPFQQAESTTTREFGGTGLGLSLCKQLVELLDGEIGVNSEIGIGSRFWFSLNVALSTETSELKIPNEYKNQYVLIVGDDVLLNESFTKYLTRLNIPFVEAATADEANKIVDSNSGSQKPVSLFISSSTKLFEQIDVNMYDVTVWCQDEEDDLPSAAQVLQLPVTYSSVLNIICGKPHESLDNLSLSKYEGRVLVVEDNEVNQLVISGMLSHFGIDAVLASNGYEALTILEEQTFDVVLMDVQMPGIDGYEVTRRLRNSKMKNKDVAVVALTANVMKEHVDIGMKAGMNDYMSKPISLHKLDDLFVRYLPVSSDSAADVEEIKTLPDESIDTHAVNQLKMLMGDEFVGFVDLFLKQSNKHIDMLEAEIGNDKAKSLLHAHSIKGSTANIGALKLADITARLEAALEKDDIDTAEKLLAAVNDELDAVSVLLKA